MAGAHSLETAIRTLPCVAKRLADIVWLQEATPHGRNEERTSPQGMKAAFQRYPPSATIIHQQHR